MSVEFAFHETHQEAGESWEDRKAILDATVPWHKVYSAKNDGHLYPCPSLPSHEAAERWGWKCACGKETTPDFKPKDDWRIQEAKSKLKDAGLSDEEIADAVEDAESEDDEE